MAKITSRSYIFRIAYIVIALIFSLWFLKNTFLGTRIGRLSNTMKENVFTLGADIKGYFSYNTLQFDEYQRIFETLKEGNATLRKENIQLNLLRKENDQLKELLHYSPANTNLLLGQIIGRPSDDLVKAWIINRGLRDGVKVGQAVITHSDRLIGIISKVYSTSSLVLAITDQHFKVGAMTLSVQHTNGLVQGSFGIGLTMKLIPKTEHIDIGDVVITSGIEEKIPKGLYIGTVEEITTGSNDLFQSAVLSFESVAAHDYVGVIQTTL